MLRWIVGEDVRLLGPMVHPDICSTAEVFPSGQDPFGGMTDHKQVLVYFSKHCLQYLAQLITPDEAAAFLLNRPHALVELYYSSPPTTLMRYEYFARAIPRKALPNFMTHWM